MNDKISVLRTVIIIVIGILSLTLATLLIFISSVVCFVKNKIELWEYIGLLCFVIYDCIVYIFIFKYFMINKVYKVLDLNSKYIIFVTQFKEYRIKRSDIIDKNLRYFVGYSLKVKYNGKVKNFFVKDSDVKKFAISCN